MSIDKLIYTKEQHIDLRDFVPIPFSSDDYNVVLPVLDNEPLHIENHSTQILTLNIAGVAGDDSLLQYETMEVPANTSRQSDHNWSGRVISFSANEIINKDEYAVLRCGRGRLCGLVNWRGCQNVVFNEKNGENE